MTEKEKVIVRALIVSSVLIGVFWIGVMAGKSMCDKPVEEITKEQIIQEISFEDSVYNYIHYPQKISPE